MSTNRSVDRSTVTYKKDRSTVTHKKDRSGLCSFTFTDGRQCRTPRRAGHPHLCFFHARREAQSLAAEAAGRDISSFLSGDYLSACDLSSALGRLFAAVAQGNIKPKTASTLAYLGQTLIQSIQVAEHEYINAFGTNSWRETVRSSFAPPDPQEEEAPNQTPRQTLPPPQLANRSCRHTLPCLRRAPNSFSMSWPVGTCPERSRRRPVTCFRLPRASAPAIVMI